MASSSLLVLTAIVPVPFTAVAEAMGVPSWPLESASRNSSMVVPAVGAEAV